MNLSKVFKECMACVWRVGSNLDVHILRLQPLWRKTWLPCPMQRKEIFLKKQKKQKHANRQTKKQVKLTNTNNHTQICVLLTFISNLLQSSHVTHLLLHSPVNPAHLQRCVSPSVKHSYWLIALGIVGKLSTKFDSEKPS